MNENLMLDDVAALLKTDADAVRDMFEAGRLHGVRRGDTWMTTRELLQDDLELLTEAGRIDRLRAGIVPSAPGPDGPHPWMTLEWVDGALAKMRET